MPGNKVKDTAGVGAFQTRACIRDKAIVVLY